MSSAPSPFCNLRPSCYLHTISTILCSSPLVPSPPSPSPVHPSLPHQALPRPQACPRRPSRSSSPSLGPPQSFVALSLSNSTAALSPPRYQRQKTSPRASRPCLRVRKFCWTGRWASVGPSICCSVSRQPDPLCPRAEIFLLFKPRQSPGRTPAIHSLSMSRKFHSRHSPLRPSLSPPPRPTSSSRWPRSIPSCHPRIYPSKSLDIALVHLASSYSPLMTQFR